MKGKSLSLRPSPLQKHMTLPKVSMHSFFHIAYHLIPVLKILLYVTRFHEDFAGTSVISVNSNSDLFSYPHGASYTVAAYYGS